MSSHSVDAAASAAASVSADASLDELDARLLAPFRLLGRVRLDADSSADFSSASADTSDTIVPVDSTPRYLYLVRGSLLDFIGCAIRECSE